MSMFRIARPQRPRLPWDPLKQTEVPMPFQIHALPRQPFAALFALSDSELRDRNMRRVTADTHPGFPCRVSLADADPGEELILLNHQHLDAASPYAESRLVEADVVDGH
mgnify:CR=1 FL=1